MQTSLTMLRHPYVFRFAIGMGIVANLLLLGLRFDLNKAEWASWVQALGSVAAIWWAMWVAGGQRRAELRSRNQAESSRFKTVQVMFENVYATAGTIEAARHDAAPVKREKHYSALEGALIPLVRIGAFEYPDERLLLLSGAVQNSTFEATKIVRTIRENSQNWERSVVLDADPLHELLKTIISSAELGVEICGKEIAKRPVSA